jgi:hypothetical protein
VDSSGATDATGTTRATDSAGTTGAAENSGPAGSTEATDSTDPAENGDAVRAVTTIDGSTSSYGDTADASGTTRSARETGRMGTGADGTSTAIGAHCSRGAGDVERVIAANSIHGAADRGTGDRDDVIAGGSGQGLATGNAGSTDNVVTGPVGGSGTSGRIGVCPDRGHQREPGYGTYPDQDPTELSGRADACS